jgi:2-polyprenyl-6-methoxyphenol hydroxylase-like FAD-dependent oxidoreductase
LELAAAARSPSGLLARAGWSVLLVDKATFPSDTISTHVIFPNTLARFEELGILERLTSRYRLSRMQMRWRIIGHLLTGRFTPIGGYDWSTSIRRIALDEVLVEWAEEAGAHTRFGARVTGLLGTGTDEDPVCGVMLQDGDEVRGRWVIGADGRASTIASLLNLKKKKPMAGEMSYLLAYFRGLATTGFNDMEVNDAQQGMMHVVCEDDIDLLSVVGPPEMTRGSTADRERAFAQTLHAFPRTFEAALLDRAERISELVVVPETMMRGFFRRSNGPGWALVGDAGHFKHPGTAQGISDAVEQAAFLAGAATGDDPDLASYPAWRRERSRGHYEWSFAYGSWPVAGTTEPYMHGLTSEDDATQDWLDTFTRRRHPEEVNTPERLGRWFAPATAGLGMKIE